MALTTTLKALMARWSKSSREPYRPLRPIEHFEYAEQFFNAFGRLPQGLPPSWPRYFLLCHSIELALKAYLAADGTSPSQLKGFRHNLKKLLKKATKKGLRLSVSAKEQIRLLDKVHANFWHRYPPDHGSIKDLPLIDYFVPAVRELLQAVGAAVRGTIG
jgi:hypothetical protein